MVDINNAKKETDEMFSYLSEVANEIVGKYSEQLDDLIKQLSKNIDSLSNEELRTYMAKISVESYVLSIDREQTSLKESCATALYKEGMANSYNKATGTIEARRNQSVLDTMDKQAVSMLYSTVSALFKAKVDEAHRIASILSSILISRASEAKLQYSPRSISSDNISQNTADETENETMEF